MIVDKLNEYLSGEGRNVNEAILEEVGNLAKWAFQRQLGERKEKSTALRLSSIGRCIRQQAYNMLGFEQNGKAIDSRAKVVFIMGDICELVIVGLIKQAGIEVQNTGQDQILAVLDSIEGHPDGVILINDQKYLLEVKSMSSYGFDEFQRGVLEEGYRYQINAYMEALGLTQCVVIGLKKDAGVLHEMIVSKDPVIVADIKSRIQTLKAVTQDNLPERPYKPNDKGFYPWNCLYCPVHMTCLPNAEKVLVGKVYKLKQKEILHHAPALTP